MKRRILAYYGYLSSKVVAPMRTEYERAGMVGRLMRCWLTTVPLGGVQVFNGPLPGARVTVDTGMVGRHEFVIEHHGIRERRGQSVMSASASGTELPAKRTIDDDQQGGLRRGRRTTRKRWAGDAGAAQLPAAFRPWPYALHAHGDDARARRSRTERLDVLCAANVRPVDEYPQQDQGIHAEAGRICQFSR